MNIFKENASVGLETQHAVRPDKKPAQNFFMKAWKFLLFLTVFICYIGSMAVAKGNESTKEYLENTGMPTQEIEALDYDVRQFIVDDLRGSGKNDWKINTDILALTKTDAEQNRVVFYINVYAFQKDSEHRIYAVYESSTEIMPTGNDKLFLCLGDSFVPYEYGGQIWYKKAGDGGWTEGGGLTANGQLSGGGTFVGRQLGDFRRKMLVKGCAYCYAHEGDGDDSRVTVDYTYHPPRERSEAGVYILIVAVTAFIVMVLRRKE